MKRSHWTWATLLVAAGLAAWRAGSGSHTVRAQQGASPRVFVALATGSQEAPAAVDTLGVAFGRFVLSADGRELSYTVYLPSGLRGKFAAMHLHRGRWDQVGPVIYPLPAPTDGKATGTISFNPSDEADLASQGLYLNIHTDVFPAGEIRGQVVSSPDAGIGEHVAQGPSARVFVALATGSEEIPLAVDTLGVAFGRFVLSGDGQQLSYTVYLPSELKGKVTDMHLHRGMSGEVGPVVYPLPAPTEGKATGTVSFNPSDEADLASQRLYLNIHTDANPEGEVRGQVVSSPDAGIGEEAPQNAVSFADEIQPIFNAKCSCHTDRFPSMGMNLEPGQAYANIVNVKSGESSLDRIEPFDPSKSYMIYKLHGTQRNVGGSGARMPLGATPLDQPSIDLITRWVQEGARNTAAEDTSVSLVIDRPRLEFGKVLGRRKALEKLMLRNEGTRSVTGTVGTLTAPFTLVTGGGDFSLATGAERDIVVEFAPTSGGGPGKFQATLIITSKTPRASELKVSITGEAVGI
jgi:hypothetical protein